MTIIAIIAFMGLEKASVAHAKNTLSSLINKVAYGKTRILLESRGKPKAALVSTEDLERLERLEAGEEAPEVRLHIVGKRSSSVERFSVQRNNCSQIPLIF